MFNILALDFYAYCLDLDCLKIAIAAYSVICNIHIVNATDEVDISIVVLQSAAITVAVKVISMYIYYAAAPIVGALSDDAHLIHTSVAYIRPKSRTARPWKTKIGTEVAHVTRNPDTTFKVKWSKVNLQGAGAYCGGLPHSLCYRK